MKISGWGRYPQIEASLLRARDGAAVQAAIAACGSGMIARGLGRSYGDSALAPQVLDTRQLDCFLHFDSDSGELDCGAGVSLGEIIACLLPRGWFPAVVPGTRFVSVGGAIASDVHGKNHHHRGSFSDQLISLRMATAGEGIVECSRDERPELFRATCGGMGLTGVILSARFRLQRVASAALEERSYRAPNLRAALELFREHAGAEYSVAWIDCSAGGDRLGRSVLRLGEHSGYGELESTARRGPAVPCDMPACLLNRYSIGAFNSLYYALAGDGGASRRVALEPYFFPLDGIRHWNRLYGRGGFIQYQCVLPEQAGEAGLGEMLKRISATGLGSFLAVLKAFGPGNDNYLSFPMAGYTLALDFKRSPGLDELLRELDRIVVDCGGRLYLAKDARMPEAVFKQTYPDWESFVQVRARYGADRVFHSLQSRRLGI